MPQLVRPMLHRERHRHRPKPETGEQRDRQLDHIGQLDPNRVTRPHTSRPQRSRSTINPGIDLSPRQTLRRTTIDRRPVRRIRQRLLVGSGRNRTLHQLIDRGRFSHRTMIADVTTPR